VQGDERDMVIVTPATSDPNAIAETAEFILDPHRATVAFTRSRHRLIVVCARDLLARTHKQVRTSTERCIAVSAADDGKRQARIAPF
jgi:superfamily I DNA and/or RNA helicase